MKTLLKISIGLVLVALLLVCSYTVQRRMNRIRETEKLTATVVVENAPPVVAFTTLALGSFRGIVADMLWLRLQRKQEEGSYFEMVQLASWITKLQPRFTGATAYLAWNMAYNISVTFNSPEDRWRWVQRGIELIRDEALLYNPSDPTLFKELGWIYQHKLGQEMDDANLYYKWQLASQMMEVFGEYPVDWEEWAGMPIKPDEFAESLAGDAFTGLKRLVVDPPRLDELESGFWNNGGELPQTPIIEVLDPQTRTRLELFLRVRRLQNGLKLDPERMAALDAEYGDFDWRLPEAHAIYWASRGLEASEGAENIFCERMVFQSLHNAFSGGRLIYLETGEDGQPILQFTPNVELADAVNAAYHVSLEQHEENRSVRSSHKNYLRHAIVTLFTFGRNEQAGEYLEELRERYPNPDYNKPLEDFALGELAGDIGTANYDQGQGLVQGYLWQTCYNLALGEFDRAAAMELIARKIWLRYMDTIGRGTHKRRGLAPFAEMRESAFRRCVETFPPELAARLRAAANEFGDQNPLR
mgnify:CR=1 FL=1